jgi:hypothetical protein
MNALTQRQIRFNNNSRDCWESFTQHRRNVTELLRGATAAGTSRLCVLGAGNCNDLDLKLLLGCHREVHLVDLDGEALAQGVARQGLATHPALHRHGNIDLSGMLGTLAGWSPTAAPGPADLATCMEEPLWRLRSTLPGPFDVVASTCLLTQLLGVLTVTVGEGHPRFLELLQAIRAGHLRLLTGLIGPGGSGVLITDIVSADSFPALTSVTEAALPGILPRLIQQRNFFHGVNPAILTALFRTDPVLASQVAELQPLPPWRWQLGARLYAVWAIKVRRNGDTPPARDCAATGSVVVGS